MKETMSRRHAGTPFRQWCIWAGLVMAGVLVASTLTFAQPGPEVTIYFNGSCYDCAPYLDHELVPLLRSLGAGEITRRDYILERRYRKELLDRSTALGIPPQLQGHMTIFIGDRIILQGHVPSDIVRDLFAPTNAARYSRIVVLQDKMTSHGDVVTHYTIWAPGAAVTTASIKEPVATYLATLRQGGPIPPAPGSPAASTLLRTMNLSWKILLVTLPRFRDFGIALRLRSFAFVCASPFFA